MLNSRVQQAVAAALALSAAAAANAANVDITTVAAANVLYASGSTAIDPGLTSYFIAGATAPCSTNGADPAASFYTGTVAGKKFIAVACTGAAGSPFAAQPIAIIKEDNGGSLFGIDPVRDDVALPSTGTQANTFPDYTTLTSTNCPGAPVAAPASAACTGYAVSTVHPNLGFADVEPAAFQDSIGTATQFGTLDVVFAPAVNVGLYHELQTAQSLTVGSDLAAAMPQLTKAQLTAIFSGAIADWAKVIPAAGTTPVNWGVAAGTTWNGTATVASTVPVSANPSTTTVFICQRGQSSGTERAAEIFFEGQNCATGTLVLAKAIPATIGADGVTWATSFTADKNFAGAGTGDLLACLQGADKAGHLAIGFASIENPWGSFQGNTARKDFRYIRYNDAVPSIQTAAAGAYDYWVQSVGVAPAATNGNAASGVAGQVASFIQTGANRIGSVASVANLNATHVYETGNWEAGFLTIPDGVAATPNAATATVSTFEGNPVNVSTRFGTGVSVTNNCQTPVVHSSAPSSSNAPAWLIPALF